MSTLYDLDHYFSNDVSVSATGDLGSVTGLTKGQQRVLRRLMTNPLQENPDGTVLPPDYIFHPDYGAGLARYIGQAGKTNEIIGRIRSQMLLEEAVARNPAPVIKVQEIANGIVVDLKYTDAETNQTTTLNFDVTR